MTTVAKDNCFVKDVREVNISMLCSIEKKTHLVAKIVEYHAHNQWIGQDKLVLILSENSFLVCLYDA